VEAALAASFDDIMDLQERAKALHDLENEADFEPLVIAFKRVVNISRSSSIVEVDCRRFEHPSETILFEAYSQIRQRVLEKTAHKNYFQALKDLSSLRRPVDDFFDNVLVMSDDEKVKVNRLSLLGQIAQLFLKIGDFSKFTAA
jgi:glycyl-tRNA synthetase beta chain